jgi:hypothetical protein
MSDQSTSLRDQLIEAGVWSADNPADPETDRDAASFLRDQLRDQLADGVILVEKTTGVDSFYWRVTIVRGELLYSFPDEPIRNAAICRAALLLPEFLRQHPSVDVSKSKSNTR